MPKKSIDCYSTRVIERTISRQTTENQMLKSLESEQGSAVLSVTNRSVRFLCTLKILAVVLLLSCIGCGSNRFQQELQVEEIAIKLVNETMAGEYPLVATKELKRLLDAGEEVLLVDTMPGAASYAKGHISGAVNFTFPKVVIDEWNENSMGERKIEEFESFLGSDKNRKIVFYCGYVKCPRSHNGAVFAKQLGYTNVVRYPGGIDAWRGAGFALTTK